MLFHIACHSPSTSVASRPKITGAILRLGAVLDEVALTADTAPVADILTALIAKTGLVEALRASRDPQDEARAENIEELAKKYEDPY